MNQVASLFLVLILLAAGLAACDQGDSGGATTRPASVTTRGNERATTVPTQPAKLTEQEKIEALIAEVENLRNAVFIRNDAIHSAREAGKHMRDKWRMNRGKIKTARDFIREAASKSSVTGKAYEIRFGDGRSVTSEKYLTKALMRLEQPRSAPRPTGGETTTRSTSQRG